VSAPAVAARTYVAIGALLALGGLFASLGTWQLRRAEASRETFAAFAARAAEAPLATLPDAFSESQRFLKVEVRGEYLPEPQILLDNMLHDGAAGYHVLTSLRVAGRRELALVNRGWVPLRGDRSTLPDIVVDAAPRHVVGRLERLPRPGLRLGGVEPPAAATATAVLQFPTADEIGRLLGEPVLDYQLLLEPAEPDGYVRDWRAPGMRAERHLSYAGQWFALAVGSVAAALVIAWKTARRRA
jgi:surfeit locus 1 family protein